MIITRTLDGWLAYGREWLPDNAGLPVPDGLLGDTVPENLTAEMLAALPDKDVGALAVIAVSAVSEEGFCAIWMSGVEFDSLAWTMLVEYGRTRLTPLESQAFRLLRTRLGDRWVRSVADGFELCPIAEIRRAG